MAGLVPALFSAVSLFVSCDSGHGPGEDSSGYMRLSFPEDMYKAALEKTELPDTNDFLLEIRSADGDFLYSGLFGDSPETMEVPPGSYTVSARSFEFERPQFSKPQYGDERCVVVGPGSIVNVRLECRQINSGIRLRISPDFLDAFPDGVLFVSSEDGKLMYGYSEQRIAYFRPGSVSLVLNNQGEDSILMTRSLESREILTVEVSVSGGFQEQNDGISISVDTSRVWSEEEIVIGGDDSKGDTPRNAISVSRARENAGAEDVWVYGYIVGGDLSRTSVSFSPPFSSASNLAMASRSSVMTRESCLSVSIPSGEIRDAVNLVAHPDNLGRQLFIKGDIVESYFGLTGIKNVTEYILE